MDLRNLAWAAGSVRGRRPTTNVPSPGRARTSPSRSRSRYAFNTVLGLIASDATTCCAGRRRPVPAVETVRGPVGVDDLGPTLMHEHVFVLSTEHVQNYGEGSWWEEEARVADAVAKLRAVRAKGIRTIVDPTVWGLGR